MDVQHKSFDLDLKDSSDGSFTAYFAVFGNVDRSNEVIDSKAFKNLESYSADGWIGTNHDMDLFAGIAYPTEVSQDQSGLRIRGKWHSTPDAQQVRTKIKERIDAGKRVKCSIGYKVLDSFSDIVNGKSVRRLTAVDLYEASFVNLPANPSAEVISAKSQEGSMDEKVVTLDALKDWVASLEQKGGRVISKSNHMQLKCWHKSLSECCDGLKKMIDTHDPEKNPGDDPDADKGVISAGDGATSREEQLAAGKSFLKLRASIVRARLRLADPQPTR